VPIKIIETAEPMSFAPEYAPSILIESSARQTLLHELRQYCKGYIRGRSFLIAGHRGAGKTTMVLNAFQVVLQECNEGKFDLRPLLVLLQGPSLLPNPDEPHGKEHKSDGTGTSEGSYIFLRLACAAKKSADSETGKKASNEAAAAKDSKTNSAREGDAASGTSETSPGQSKTGAAQMENILKQITLGLHRALTKEVADAFRKAIVMRSGRMPKSQFYDLLELAAELKLELDGYPGHVRLREFWRRAGVLRDGVLRPRSRQIDRDDVLTLGSPPVDQGFLELVALSSVCDAYRRISGTIKSEEQFKSGAERKQEARAEFESKGKELLAPLIPLLSGGAAAAAMLTARPNAGAGAALAGFVTALAAAVTLKFSASWSRQQSSAREDLFIPDLSVATLDRVLPVLIERIRNAGLAPVFVVDELDKVSGLRERMHDMVQRLKKLVAEDCYFCFLTDRTYFEEVRERALKTPYSIEYTYYSDKLFVAFKHHELHEFVRRVLVVETSASPSATAGAIPTGAVEQQTLMERLVSPEMDDSTVLPFVLLHWSEMHAIDLWRRLESIRDENGNVNISLGKVRTDLYYRLQVMIQFAIETLLEAPKMESELRNDPTFRRLAHDALYYISRKWQDAPKELVLDETSETVAAFEKYLRDRMETDPLPPATYSPREQPSIDPAQRDFLLGCVRELALLLASPEDLASLAREKARENKLDRVVVQAISIPPPQEPLYPHQVVEAFPYPEWHLYPRPPEWRLYPLQVVERIHAKANFDPEPSPYPLLPLLQPSGDRSLVYRWCFHRSGREVVEGQATEEPPTAAPAAAAWKADDELIRAVKEAVRNLSGGSVDFVALSSHSGVIARSPDWAVVEPALQRLRDAGKTGQPYGEQESDLRAVSEFSTVLKTSGEVIARSLACATVLGSFGQVEADQTLVGLNVIANAFGFPQLGLEAVRTSLSDLMLEMLRRASVTEPLSEVPRFSDSDSVKSWTTWVENSVNLLKTLPLRTSVVPEAQKAAWDGWFQRLQAGAARPPNFDDLICAAKRVPPATLLKFDIGAMTLGDWSRAYYSCATEGDKSSEIGPPAWFALSALDRLGFNVEVDSSSAILELIRPSLEQKERLEDWKPVISPARRELSVAICTLLKKSLPTSPSGWLPSMRGAAIILGPEEICDLCKRRTTKSQNIFDLLGVKRLAFEVAANPEEAAATGAPSAPERTSMMLPQEVSDPILNCFTGMIAPGIPLIVSKRPIAEVTGAKYFLIIAPGSLDELFERMTPPVA
jgi:hypothetical protein